MSQNSTGKIEGGVKKWGASPRKEGNSHRDQIRSWWSETLQHLEIQTQAHFVEKATLVSGPLSCRMAELSFFYQGYIYRETRDIKESDVFEYCVWQHSTWIRSLGKRASTMNLQAQCCMEPTELCRALMNNKPETRKVRKPIGWSSLLWPTT